MKTIPWQILATVLIGCLALAQNSQAVIPPPDGGYPGFNTAEGQNALFSLTTGIGNTATGWFSLWSNSDGSFNTGVGAGSLLFNTGNDNTAVGGAALLFNTSGSENTALGAAALLNNTVNGGNTAVGSQALRSNTTGSYNTADGAFALENNTTGSGNVGNGAQTLRENVAGSNNTATGFLALYHNMADRNTANGYGALSANTTGTFNTANGSQALESNTTAAANTATGALALNGNNGGQNTADGYAALSFNSTGNFNTALGYAAGANVSTADNVICIGATVAGENVSSTCYIGNIFGVTSSGGAGVFVNSAGKLGTGTSSRRFKEDVKPMDQTSEAILALQPVTFRYKKEIDPARRSHFGLVAEDVEKVNPDLIVRDKEGKPYTVRYDQVNAMLLNEFLKEHRTVQELKKEIAALASTVKQQAAQIQKVTAQIETSKATPQMVLNGQ